MDTFRRSLDGGVSEWGAGWIHKQNNWLEKEIKCAALCISTHMNYGAGKLKLHLTWISYSEPELALFLHLHHISSQLLQGLLHSIVVY